MDKVFLEYACDIIADTSNGLTGTEIIKYCRQYSLKYDVEIPVHDTEMLKTTYKPQVPNKRTALYRNLIVFSKEQQIEILNDLCNLPKFSMNDEIKEIQIKLKQKYSDSTSSYKLDHKEIEETKGCLTRYKTSLKLYEEALEKYEKGIYQRNVLDDMRLALESLIKEILNNNKSLENQISELGLALKSKDVSNEIRNLFNKVIDYYSTYQNSYVKHNDSVKLNEMEFIISQTNSMIKFLIENFK